LQRLEPVDDTQTDEFMIGGTYYLTKQDTSNIDANIPFTSSAPIFSLRADDNHNEKNTDDSSQLSPG
jgi:hypothetical protein